MGGGWLSMRHGDVSILCPPLYYQDAVQHTVLWTPGKSSTRLHGVNGLWFTDPYPVPPCYTTDFCACAEMRKQLREIGKHEDFAQNLTLEIAAVFVISSEDMMYADDVFDLIDASPLEQVQAALKAVGVTVEEGG